MVSSHYPRTLVNYIKKQYQVSIEKAYPGIYYVTGLMFPVQTVVNSQLLREENVWLSRLWRNLTAREDVEPLARAYKGREHHPLYSAAMDLIVQANEELYEEEKHVCDALRNLFAAELVEREQKDGLLRLISQVCKKLTKNQPIDMIADSL